MYVFGKTKILNICTDIWLHKYFLLVFVTDMAFTIHNFLYGIFLAVFRCCGYCFIFVCCVFVATLYSSCGSCSSYLRSYWPVFRHTHCPTFLSTSSSNHAMFKLQTEQGNVGTIFVQMPSMLARYLKLRVGSYAL